MSVSTELVPYRPQNVALRALTAPARGLKSLSRMVFGTGPGIIWRFLPRTRFDYAREIGDGMSSSIIMAPVLWMARTLPEAPIQVLDPDSQPVDHHPLVRLLRRPNPYYSGIAMWMATLISWVIDGNAYWIKVRNKAGTGVVQLWYVPHWLITPVGTEDEFITAYRYAVGGQVIPLDPADVVHFRYGLDPRDPRKGLSPLGTLFREVFTDEEAANFAASLLRNTGVPGLIVSPDGGAPAPNEDDVRATKTYVREGFAGDRRGEPLVMSGPTKVQQFGFSPAQMQVKDLRRVPEERVTAILGLSAMVVGLGAGLDRSTFANYAEAREAAYESNIIPTQRLMAEELRHQLLIPDFQDGQDDGSEVVFDLRNVRVLQDDRNQEATRLAQLYTAGIITRREARTPLGQESDDGDDVYAVPITAVLTPAAEPVAQRVEEPDEAKRRDLAVKGRAPSQASDRLIEAFGRDRERLVPVLSQEIELDLDGLARNAADTFEAKHAEKLGRLNGSRTKGQEQDIVAELLAALNIAGWKEEVLVKRLETHYLRTAGMTVDTINAVLELGLMLPDQVARQIFEDGGTRAGLIDIEQQTKDAIMRALADGREAGEGPIEIARRIRSYVPAGRFVNAGAKYRAELIARTETLNAQRISSLAAYQSMGNVTAIEVRDGLLPDSDAECEDRDGDIVSFTEAQALAADEHPLGTLSFSPVV